MTVKVDAQLKLKKSDAVLVIRSKPIADISVDGKAIGRVPLEFHIAAGSHNLLAEASGYETEQVPMTLALGDRRELDIELHKSPSITSRWWFWTAIAGVVEELTGANEVTRGRPSVGRPGKQLRLSQSPARLVIAELGVERTRLSAVPAALPDDERWDVEFRTPGSEATWRQRLRQHAAALSIRRPWGVMVSVPD